MSNEIVDPAKVMETFKEKVQAKVRDDIAAMLPDDALAALVQQAVQDVFFKPRRVDKNADQRYGSPQWVDVPSWFVEAVTEAVKPMMAKQVAAFVEANSATIQETIAQTLKPENLTLLAVGRLGVGIEVALNTLANAIRNGNRNF